MAVRPDLLTVGPGDFVLTEGCVADAGAPTAEHRLPDPDPLDPAALGHAAARHGIELLGPPPGH